MLIKRSIYLSIRQSVTDPHHQSCALYTSDAERRTRLPLKLATPTPTPPIRLVCCFYPWVSVRYRKQRPTKRRLALKDRSHIECWCRSSTAR